MVRLDTTNLANYLEAADFDGIAGRVHAAHEAVLNRTGAGSEKLGWRELVLRPDDALLGDIAATAAEIRAKADVFLCIGIGGSYLGARAVISALTPYFRRDDSGAEVLFAGHHLSGPYLEELLRHLDGKSVYVNVISKSGTTLEPAITFRVVRDWMNRQFDDADDRIVVTTDATKGTLNKLRAAHGYRHYVIPDDIGGRFSVLTPVGLLPIAVAGVDIQSLFYGAGNAARRLTDPDDNDALTYAAARYLLHESGYMTEVLAVFEPRLLGIASWWQQLFGESEGKKHKGLFPAMVQYTTDLHSLGQYLQDGRRSLIETFLLVDEEEPGAVIPRIDDGTHDGLDYLAGQSLSAVNARACEGTIIAHTEGGVPTMTVRLETRDAGEIGDLIYFFEHAVAVGGYLLGVNPFVQPGVEAYKKEMYRLLGR